MRQTEFLATACDPKTLTVGQLMQDAGLYLWLQGRCFVYQPHDDTAKLRQACQIVEEDRTLVGLVSEYDLLQAMIDGRDLRKIMASKS